MVYIRIPEKAKPGKKYELDLHNTFTRCSCCGKEIALYDAFYDSNKKFDFIPDELVCWNCGLQMVRDDVIKLADKLLEAFTLFPECHEEDDEDE